MTEHWAFWIGGAALAGVAAMHWILLRRMFAVSGRFTALTDRVRHGEVAAPELTDLEMIEAMRAMTAEELGEEAVGQTVEPAAPIQRAVQGPWVHVTFLVSLVAGGALAAATTGGIAVQLGLSSELFPRIFGTSPWAAPVTLLVGGLLVGFGTRMAGGCTSGHGLCGVSRFQPGSLLATAAFFGTGVLVSFALARLL